MSPPSGGSGEKQNLSFIFPHEDDCSREEGIRTLLGYERDSVAEHGCSDIHVLYQPVPPFLNWVSNVVLFKVYDSVGYLCGMREGLFGDGK